MTIVIVEDGNEIVILCYDHEVLWSWNGLQTKTDLLWSKDYTEVLQDGTD